jgi:hypothetical protein
MIVVHRVESLDRAATPALGAAPLDAMAVVVLTGARQTGKSTLAQQVGARISST